MNFRSRRSSASAPEIAGDKVTVTFSTAASAMIFTRDCVFMPDAAAQTWTVHELVSPRDTHGLEASGSCHETEGWLAC